MTISASNTNLLALTKRKSDNEYKNLTTNNNKQTLKYQTSKIANEYNNKTNVSKSNSEPQINKELADVRKYINQNKNKSFKTFG